MSNIKINIDGIEEYIKELNNSISQFKDCNLKYKLSNTTLPVADDINDIHYKCSVACNELAASLANTSAMLQEFALSQKQYDELLTLSMDNYDFGERL